MDKKSINELYKSILLDIWMNGQLVNPRGSCVKEIRNYQITLEDINDKVITVWRAKTNLPYAKTELQWYLDGSNRIDFHKIITKVWKRYSDDGETVNSAYGHRIFGTHNDFVNQWEWVLQELRADPDSRRAVININYSGDKILPTKDNPCTMYIQVFVRRGRLHWTVNMRSNDVYFGFRNDM
ncbi:MAG: hypothetical protein KAS04_04515, partial [Candidatus Aenigmarchaeota archaeon]|nr:hypothetical protein [Candidatus Aenigmarchaeota archaeon]